MFQAQQEYCKKASREYTITAAVECQCLTNDGCLSCSIEHEEKLVSFESLSSVQVQNVPEADNVDSEAKDPKAGVDSFFVGDDGLGALVI